MGWDNGPRALIAAADATDHDPGDEDGRVWLDRVIARAMIRVRVGRLMRAIFEDDETEAA